MYNYPSLRLSKALVTRQESKADNTFTRQGEIWYKEVPEAYITDIFTVELQVRYDAHYPNTPEMWKIENLTDTLALIRFREGIIPGWTVEGDNVCSKWVSLVECPHATAVYTFERSDGYKMPPGTISQVDVPMNSLHRVYEDYIPYKL